MQRTNYKNIKKLGLLIIAFEGTEHLYNIISELRDSVDYVSIGLQRLSYHGDKISEIDLQEIFRLRDEDHLVDNIVEVKLDTTKPAREQETDKRNMLIQDAQDNGCTHAIVIDSDEYYTKKAFESACKIIDDNNYPITYCQYINYYHDYKHFLVYPFKDGMYVPFVTRVEYRHSFECTDFLLPSDPTRRFVRPYSGVENVVGRDGQIHKIKQYTVDYHVFKWNEVKMHHLSWLRADIRKKLEMWSSKKCFDNYDDLIDRAVNSFNNFDERCDKAQALMLFNTPGNTVDVKAFPKQYIHPKVDYNTRLRKVKNYKKLIVLSMCMDKPLYNELEKVCQETWKTNIDDNMNIDFWVYTDAKEGEDTHVDESNHMIYIKREYTQDEDALYHDFLEREKEFSTGLQDGFAIPHARTDNVKKVTVMFLRNKNGIDWQTLDDQPVKYIFALLVPKQSAGDVHLKMISSLATALLEDEFKDTIISSNDKAELTRYILKMMEEEN